MNLRNSLAVTLLKQSSFIRAGVAIIVFFTLVALISLFYLPYSPLAPSGPVFSPPSPKHLFGTTVIGQDVLSQWIFGSRSTLLVGFLTAALTTLIGIAVGLVSGYIRWSDELLMRSTDIVLTLPTLPLLIVLAAFTTPTLVFVAVLISLLSWPAMARVLRSSVVSMRELPFIEVAILSGVSRRSIMFKDLLRHLVPLILAFSLFAVIGGVLTEATLDFIGVGPITDYSWGAMIALAQTGNAAINGAWWWVLIPGLSIAVFCTGFALVAYGLEGVYRKN